MTVTPDPKPPITEEIVGDQPMEFLEDVIVIALGVLTLKLGWNGADHILPPVRKGARGITVIQESGPGGVQEAD